MPLAVEVTVPLADASSSVQESGQDCLLAAGASSLLLPTSNDDWLAFHALS